MEEPVGFVGLGVMGAPMAASLVRAGRRVVGFDAAGATVAGAEAAPDLAALAALCPSVVLMLPDSPAVAAVLERLEPALRPGALVVDMGSSIPAETRRWEARLRARGAALVDAPVSGSVVKAHTGTLAIMAGGAPEAVDRAEPLLRLMGERVIRAGGPGAGHAVKALNNFVYAAGLLAVSEAAVLAERAGLDLGVLEAVLNSSSGRNVASETKLGPDIVTRRYAGGFRLALMRKDIETAATLADATATPARLLQLLRAEWAAAAAARPAAADNTEIHAHLLREETT